jgi:hypoxanthine phosphoribosyltransferase
MIVGTPLLTAEQIHQKVSELADRISRDYSDKEVVAVGILKGSFMFFSDLVRLLRIQLRIDFLMASSYVKTTTTGEVKVHCDLREDVSSRHVLLVDDIIDTGVSLNYIRERVLSRSPASLRTCILLDKKERRLVDVPVEYVGFEIPDRFVVGYGLDYENGYRNLPFISVFKKSV